MNWLFPIQNWLYHFQLVYNISTKVGKEDVNKSRYLEVKIEMFSIFLLIHFVRNLKMKLPETFSDLSFFHRVQKYTYRTSKLFNRTSKLFNRTSKLFNRTRLWWVRIIPWVLALNWHYKTCPGPTIISFNCFNQLNASKSLKLQKIVS